jgi:hypothetical protein
MPTRPQGCSISLPVCIVANYPSWDRFVVVAHPRIGITSLAEIKERRIPVRMSIREDPTRFTLVLLNQILAVHGFSLADIESWGGSFQLNGPPHDKRRMDALYADELDIIYTRASLDDETVYKVCAAIHAKDDAIPWDGDSYTDINQVWQQSPATPADVPYHAGAVQWCKDNGIKL